MVQVSGAVTETFKYNGDGQRFIATQGMTTTVYIGSYFEWHGTVTDTVKYYYSGATRVAMRVGANAPVYLMGDHLGSTSVAVDVNGALVGGSPQLYKAWGETRAGSMPTKYQYTGQFNQIELGIYYYGARWYDPSLGRFTQADTIIPVASQGVQAWDRYAYVNNNPIRYNDPSGHGGGPKADPRETGGEFYWNFFPEKQEGDEPDQTQPTTPPHPDAPPDYSNTPRDETPPPPHVDGLPDEGWEWGVWPGLGKGYRNNQDPNGTVWRPDFGYTNRPGTEGEMPHWHGRVPGEQGEGLTFPGDNKWGRPGQRTQPGVFNRETGRYEYSPLPGTGDVGVTVGVPIIVFFGYRFIRGLLSPVCGPLQLICAFGP